MQPLCDLARGLPNLDQRPGVEASEANLVRKAQESHLPLRAAKSKRDRLMLEVAYFGVLRVSDFAGLTWSQVIPRETGEAQLAIVGKCDKPRISWSRPI